MLTKKIMFIALLSLTVISPAMAKVYKWTDANGKLHYTSTPPPATTKVKESKEIKIHKTPKSSLTFKPKHRASTKAAKNTQQNRKVKKTAIRKKTNSAKNKECTDANLAEREAFMRDGERNGRKAVADGRMTQEDFERTQEMFQRAIIDCE